MQHDRSREALLAEEAALRAALSGEGRLPALLALAALYLDVGEDEGALDWLAQAEALARQEAGALSAETGRCHALRARLHALADRAGPAALEAERAVRLLSGPERGQALLLLGRARLHMGEVEAALRALEAARDGADPALLAEVEQATARALAAQGLYTRALEAVHARVALVHRLHGPDTPEAADTLLQLVAIAEADGDLESAVSAMDRAVLVLGRVLGPDHVEVGMAAAYLLALRSRLAGAAPPDP